MGYTRYLMKEEAIEAIDHIMYSSPHEATEQVVAKKYYADLLKEYIENAETRYKMTRQQREDLNYVGGKLNALVTVTKDREAASVLRDALDSIVNMLDADEVTE